jgi:hypothetical protein
MPEPPPVMITDFPSSLMEPPWIIDMY